MTAHRQLHRTVDNPDRQDEILELLADCYCDSPAWLYIFGGDLAEARRGLLFVGRARLRGAGKWSEFWVDDAGRVEGHIVLGPAHEVNTKPRDAISDLLFFPLYFGVAATARLLLLMRGFEAGEHHLRLEENPWLLAQFAVRSDRQGRGIGSGMLRAMLAERVAAIQGRCILASQEAKNLTLYERCGFHYLSREPMRATSGWFGDMDVPCWLMEQDFGTGAAGARVAALPRSRL